MARAAVNDFNNDGISDIIWFNPAEGISSTSFAHISDLYVWNLTKAGTIGFAGHLSENPTINDAAPVFGNNSYATFTLQTGDFDGNGAADIMTNRGSISELTRDGFTMGVSYLDKNYNFALESLNVAQTLPANHQGYGESIQNHALGDFNGDGKSDLVWTKQTITNNVETLSFVVTDLSHHAANATETTIATLTGASGTYDVSWAQYFTGDFNGDGTDDVLLYNFSSKDVGLWTMSHGSIASGSTLPIANTTTNGGWQIMGVGDFNGDGTSDLLVENFQGGSPDLHKVGVWTMHNGAIAGGSILSTLYGWHIETVGDYNGDGTSDVLLRSDDRQTTGIWNIHNDAITTTPSWSTDSHWSILA